MCNWLRAAIYKPYIRRLFDTLTVDNEVQLISYTMKYEIDEDSDKEFLIEGLALGLVVEWLSPKIRSIETIAQTYGSTEMKYYSEAAHLKEILALEDSCKKQQKALIRDRGYAWNTYLDGES